jgi:hypothetical protein
MTTPKNSKKVFFKMGYGGVAPMNTGLCPASRFQFYEKNRFSEVVNEQEL